MPVTWVGARADRVRGWLRSLALLVLGLTLAAAVACGTDGLLQGDAFTPDGALPTEPASGRDAAAAACDGGDGGACDAGAPDSAPVLPVADGATPPSNTCQTARAVGTVSGDTGATSLTATGTCSEWVSLRATEDNSSALGTPMKVELTLTSKGHDFDLYVYLNPVKDVLACSTPLAMSETRGTVDEIVSLTWGEGTVANGSDDGRTIGVAIQSAQGPCPPGSGWTLTANGNR
jgi:hypothetical protein